MSENTPEYKVKPPVYVKQAQINYLEHENDYYENRLNANKEMIERLKKDGIIKLP